MIEFRDAEGTLASVKVLVAQVVSLRGTDDVVEALEELNWRILEGKDVVAASRMLVESLDWLVREGKLHHEEKFYMLDDIGGCIAELLVSADPRVVALRAERDDARRKGKGLPVADERVIASLEAILNAEARIMEIARPELARWLRCAGDERLAEMVERGDERLRRWGRVGMEMMLGMRCGGQKAG